MVACWLISWWIWIWPACSKLCPLVSKRKKKRSERTLPSYRLILSYIQPTPWTHLDHKKKELSEPSQNGCGCQSILLLIRRDLISNISCIYMEVETAVKGGYTKWYLLVQCLCVCRLWLILTFFLMHEKRFFYSLWERERWVGRFKRKIHAHAAWQKDMSTCHHSFLAFLPSFQCSFPSFLLSFLPSFRSHLPSLLPFLPHILSFLPHFNPSIHSF